MNKLICLGMVLLCLPIALALDDKFSIRGHDDLFVEYGDDVIHVDLSLWSNGDKGQGHLYLDIDGMSYKTGLKQVYRSGSYILYEGKAKLRFMTGGTPSIQVLKYDTYISVLYDGGDTAYIFGTPLPVTRLR